MSTTSATSCSRMASARWSARSWAAHSRQPSTSAILAGMVLGAIAAFVIDRDFKSATIYALAGAGLSFIGFIHGTQLGITSATSQIALGYLLLGAVIWGLSRGQAAAPAADEEPEA